MKKLFALLLVIVMVLGMSTVAFATEPEAADETAAVEEVVTEEVTEEVAEDAEVVVEDAEIVADVVEETGTTEEVAKKGSFSKTLKVILTIVQVLCAVALVAIVMIQSGKEGGLSAITGSSDSFMSKNKGSYRDAKLAKTTKWIAGVFMVLTLALNLF